MHNITISTKWGGWYRDQSSCQILRRYLDYFMNLFEWWVSLFSEYDIAPSTKDALYNYCCNLCQWTLQLLSMNDTAKEGDLDRLVFNSKTILPFFFSHSARSKYFVENVDFLLKTQHLLSPMQSLRVRKCSYVNTHQGAGKNKELDLAMENSVCNRKNLIRNLGANKTEAAILRATGSADALANVMNNIASDLHIPPTSDQHTKASTQADIDRVFRLLREIRPFTVIPGRTCHGFDNILPSPHLKVDKAAMKFDIQRTYQRLSMGHLEGCESDSDWHGYSLVNLVYLKQFWQDCC